MADVYELHQHPAGRSPARPRPHRFLALKDSANLLTASTLLEETGRKLTLFARETEDPAVRELFAVLARTMGMGVTAIRDKMAGKAYGEAPHRT
jgi:hypothetical protein